MPQALSEGGHPAQPGIGGDRRDDPGHLLRQRVGGRAGPAQQHLGRRDHARVAVGRQHRRVRLVRCRSEDLPGRDHPVVQGGHRLAVERTETARPEPDAKGPALRRPGAGRRSTGLPRRRPPVRLEGQVHVRVRQDRLLVRRLAAQVPADHPVVVEERRQVGGRRIPGQREPVGRGRPACSTPAPSEPTRSRAAPCSPGSVT